MVGLVKETRLKVQVQVVLINQIGNERLERGRLQVQKIFHHVFIFGNGRTDDLAAFFQQKLCCGCIFLPHIRCDEWRVNEDSIKFVKKI